MSVPRRPTDAEDHLAHAVALTDSASAIWARHLAGDPEWNLTDADMAWAFGGLLERAHRHTDLAHQLAAAA